MENVLMASEERSKMIELRCKKNRKVRSNYLLTPWSRVLLEKLNSNLWS